MHQRFPSRFSYDHIVFGTIAALTVAFLVGIFVFLLTIGAGVFRHVSWQEFFWSSNWNPTAFVTPAWGIGALFTSTLIVTGLTVAISFPLGFAIALYLSHIAPRSVRECLKPTIEMIASIPSVVLGLLGILFVAPLVARVFGLSNGLNALTAALMVAIAALPTIASICEDALGSVPRRYEEASFALGASHWQTIRRVMIPAARSGLLAALILGLGRIIGETMIVLMVAGNSRALPQGILDPVRPMTATIAIEIKEVVIGSVHWQGLFAIGLILFVVTFVINFIADLLIRRHRV
ncbi:MAG: phosphate ABC transporter permease subunit PstC [Deltaproteobacteria bacterium RIFCSPLOWO2_02_FULL_46_8]|nr:MAG: phosphate ABC transporter permease subunit PstC [Deltaproteobacteria bacterium RIFCSPLOWO2_02_FULL_46_8]